MIPYCVDGCYSSFLNHIFLIYLNQISCLKLWKTIGLHQQHLQYQKKVILKKKMVGTARSFPRLPRTMALLLLQKLSLEEKMKFVPTAKQLRILSKEIPIFLHH